MTQSSKPVLRFIARVLRFVWESDEVAIWMFAVGVLSVPTGICWQIALGAGEFTAHWRFLGFVLMIPSAATLLCMMCRLEGNEERARQTRYGRLKTQWEQWGREAEMRAIRKSIMGDNDE